MSTRSFMARAPTPAVDPAEEAAALLRRLGFATLVLLVPATALIARRAVVILVPVGILLMVLAALIDGEGLTFGRATHRIVRSRGGFAAALVLGWCALSLAWTPFLGQASERLFNIIVTIALILAGFVALPERMRTANLYLIPVGTLAAAMAGVLLGLNTTTGRGGFDEEGQSLDRGLMVLSLFIWPAIGWLRSRGHNLEALGLAVLGGLAVALGPTPLPLIALIVGAVIYAAAEAKAHVSVRATAVVIAGLLALAPLIPFVATPLLSIWLEPGHPLLASLDVWRDLVLSQPIRLITGHGFETTLRGRIMGLIPPNAPSTVLFAIWYELGIVGALAAAVALHDGVRSATRVYPPLVPGITAAFATAFAFACLGIGTAQSWWFTALAALVLVFGAAERGQFRTARPKANVRVAEEA